MGFTSFLHFKSANFESANTLSMCECKATLPLFSIAAYISGVLPVAGSFKSKSGEATSCFSTALEGHYQI